MLSSGVPEIAIVDYGMGNLYSVERACEFVGLCPRITSSPHEVLKADGVILPGVGAFGDAMEVLERSKLVDALQTVVLRNKPFLGICLGLQLLMSESAEFGRHRGLGIIPGSVVRFESPGHSTELLKVPQVGWNRVWGASGLKDALPGSPDPWRGTPLEGSLDGEYMYFVHSFYAVPEDPSMALSVTRYGKIEFASGLRCGSVFAFQFHPERSGPQGLQVYKRWRSIFFPPVPDSATQEKCTNAGNV